MMAATMAVVLQLFMLDEWMAATGNDDFAPSVWFCCDDIGNADLQVVFRAYDCANNRNDCMVNVLVEDKIKPGCVAFKCNH